MFKDYRKPLRAMRMYFVSLLLLFFTITQAKDYIDLFKFHYLSAPGNHFDSDDTRTTYSEYVGNLVLPIKLDSSNVFIMGAGYGLYRFKYDVDVANPNNFYAIAPQLGLNRRIGKKWKGTFLYVPQILSTSEQNISGRDYQSGLVTLFEYKKRTTLSYKFGLYYLNDLRGPFLLPLLGLYYTSSSSKWECDVVLPTKADINYRLNKSVKWGINYLATVKTFYLQADESYVYLYSNQFSTYLQFALGKGLLLRTEIGVNSRKVEQYRYGDKYGLNIASIVFNDNRTQINNHWNSGIFFLKMAFKFRYHIPKPVHG